MWPLYTRIRIFTLIFIFFIFLILNKSVFFSFLLILIRSALWFRDLVRERYFKGRQNMLIQTCLKLGIIFFILREIFFFISFFWCYFHFIFIQRGELGFQWPSKGITAVNYLRVPLLNSLLLLSSGVSLTISHNLISLDLKSFNFYLGLTILLGLLFSYCQYWEYLILDFLWSDSSYGSIFFIGTGFHGLHVIIGSTILRVILIRDIIDHLLIDSIIFELGAWYWHFVDVIWIILFTEFYWWGK